MLDKSKVPSHLRARVLWVPRDASDPDDHPIAYVSERRRWLIGGSIALPLFVLGAALLLVRAPIPLVLVVMGVSIGAAYYSQLGQAGYYEVASDGSLGEYLGRKRPDLNWMRLARIH